MKFRFHFLLLLLLLFTILVPAPKAKAQGVDYVANAIEALKTSNVYVAPGTPGTDYNTPNQLSVYLQPNDNVVLIMLPIEALNGTDLLSIAQKISIGLNNEKIIGLAVGDKLIGYSNQLPGDVAVEQMTNARSVSNSTVTALFTFSRNINLWRIQNPQPIPTATPEPTPTPRPTMKPIDLPKIDTSTTSGKVSVGFIGTILIIFVILIAVKLIPVLKRIGKFQPAIKMLRTIRIKLSEVQNSRVKSELGKACSLADGLVNIYKGSLSYTGIGEDLFLVLLNNIILQIEALITHEAYNELIPDEEYDRMIRTMLNYDDLFKTLQKNDPKAIELMAANIMSENAMISHMGHLPTQK